MRMRTKNGGSHMLVAKKVHSLKNNNEVKTLYNTAFPKVERFSMLVLKVLSYKKNVYSLAFYDNDKFVGFSYFFVNDKAVFILYLATNSQIRSKGYGSQIINYIKHNFGSRDIFLDAEAPNETSTNQEQRLKRISFYKKNGIYETQNFFEHQGVMYEILSTNPNFTESDYMDNLKEMIVCLKKY